MEKKGPFSEITCGFQVEALLIEVLESLTLYNISILLLQNLVTEDIVDFHVCVTRYSQYQLLSFSW